ncbi:MAG: hypothetical protein ACE5L7_00510 [Candidatus Aminicenantales bacterium]
MNERKPGMFVPALIGGAAAGVFSAVPFLNCLCCLWIIGGAMLAAYLLSKDSPVAMTAGDGAIVGIFTGVTAAVIDAIISIPFHAINAAFVQRVMEGIAQYTEEMPSGWERWLETGAVETSAPLFMLGLLISVVVFSILGALGGIIGISLFGKKAQQPQEGAIDVPKDTGHRQS